jgi:EmrB/QacA subfamily drug resistance transporter
VSPTVPPGGRRQAITAALLLGTFLASIEVTVVATAMPSIVERLGGLALYSWVYSAYLLTQTVTIPLYGRLADLFGRRVTYASGIGIFLLGSLACGFAPSMEWLVAARALQGVGAGAVLPLTMTIFGDLYDVSARTKLQGLFSLIWGTSSVIGPLAGGLIVLNWSWPWVFWLNLPFGLASATVVCLLLREPDYHQRHRLDLVGAVLLSAATMALLLALLPAHQRPLGWPAGVWLALAVIAAALLIAQERRHPEPLVPLDLFRDRVHLTANGAGVLLGVVLFGVVGYVPLFVQAVRGGGPIAAGMALIPLSLAWTLSTFVSGRLVRPIGFQALVRGGSALIGLGALLGWIGVSRDWPVAALAGEMLYGFGMGACISSFTVSVQECVAPHRRGIATALTQFARSIGGAVGVAVLGAVLTARVGDDLQGADLAALAPGPREALGSALRLVFGLMTLSAAAAAVVGIVLFPRIETGMAARREQGPDS